MRSIDRASTFKRDYKREAKGQHRATLDSELKPVLMALVNEQPLAAKYRDHDLSGDWAGYRECHVKPDLLLIYRKSDADTLRLARLGSHSELFGSTCPVDERFHLPSGERPIESANCLWLGPSRGRTASSRPSPTRAQACSRCQTALQPP